MVKGNSEYELIRDEMITTKAAAEKEIDEGTINNTTSNIFSVHRRIEDILYNARQALNDENISPDKLAKINNIVMELEKNTMNLGAAIAEHDDKESLDKTLE